MKDVGFVRDSRESPEAQEDAEWFENHPGEDIRVRPLAEGEGFWLKSIDPVLFGRIESLAASSPVDAEIRVAVFQIRPGLRSRIPVLGRLGMESNTVRMIDAHGNTVSGEDMLSALREQTPEENPEPSQLRDDCYRCGARFKNGQPTIDTGASITYDEICCFPCARLAIGEGERPYRGSVYFDNESLNTLKPAELKKIAERGLSRIKAFMRKAGYEPPARPN